MTAQSKRPVLPGPADPVHRAPRRRRSKAMRGVCSPQDQGEHSMVRWSMQRGMDE